MVTKSQMASFYWRIQLIVRRLCTALNGVKAEIWFSDGSKRWSTEADKEQRDR